MRFNRDFVDRFWAKVAKAGPDDCWLWTRYVTPEGYGQVGFRYKLYLAHRVAWFLATGCDPGDKFVCHTCDVGRCCNEKHLFLGTQLDNMTDMIRKGRANHNKNKRGEEIGTAKLTEADVREIWYLHLNHGLGERKLGARFNVTPPNIHSILSGQSWKHLRPANPVQLVKPKTGFSRTF